jgi:hypothetical protein
LSSCSCNNTSIKLSASVVVTGVNFETCSCKTFSGVDFITGCIVNSIEGLREVVDFAGKFSIWVTGKSGSNSMDLGLNAEDSGSNSAGTKFSVVFSTKIGMVAVMASDTVTSTSGLRVASKNAKDAKKKSELTS